MTEPDSLVSDQETVLTKTRFATRWFVLLVVGFAVGGLVYFWWIPDATLLVDDNLPEAIAPGERIEFEVLIKNPTRTPVSIVGVTSCCGLSIEQTASLIAPDGRGSFPAAVTMPMDVNEFSWDGKLFLGTDQLSVLEFQVHAASKGRRQFSSTDLGESVLSADP